MGHKKIMKTKEVKEKEPKPVLISVRVRDTSTGVILCGFPPTEAGVKRASRYIGLAGLEVVKTYEKGGHKYESS